MESKVPTTGQTDFIDLAMMCRRNALLRRFLEVLRYAFSDVEPAELDPDEIMQFLAAVQQPSWFVQADTAVVAFLTREWLPAVNKIFQRKIRNSRPSEMPKLLTEEIVAMRALHGEERETLWRELEGLGLMSTIGLRLGNLVDLHVRLMGHSQAQGSETFGELIRRQDKEVKKHFPKALEEDRAVLANLALWYLAVRKDVVDPLAMGIRADSPEPTDDDVLRFLERIAGEWPDSETANDVAKAVAASHPSG